MSERISIFDRVSGVVTGYRNVEFGVEPIILKPGEDWYRGVISGSQYMNVATGEPAARAEMPIVVGVNGVTGVPSGATAIVNLEKQSEPIVSGGLHFDVDYPQVVYLTLQHEHFLIWRGEVSCVPD